MPKFRYIALNADGRQVSGQLEAEGEASAVRMLSERQLFPVNIASADASRSKRRRVSSRDIGMMYGQLADLIGSGVPMLRALDSLIRSTVHSQLKANKGPSKIPGAPGLVSGQETDGGAASEGFVLSPALPVTPSLLDNEGKGKGNGKGKGKADRPCYHSIPIIRSTSPS